ncbi:hypothetical protein [Bartonella sp. CB175]|uniref:hypothetical protein n=1 Tax=Bartonella sp. CB175 TaxID=3112256 RepID=UPI00300E15DF
MQKNSHQKSTTKISLAIPETCYQTSFLFSMPDITLCFYRITPAYKCNIVPPQKTILYAPSFLAFWALHYAVKNPHLFSSLWCHGKQWYSPPALAWLKLHLKNNRRLMGSDVPSLLIMKALHKHVAVSDYTALPIGTWLQLVNNYKTNYKQLSVPLLWLDNYKNITNIRQIITQPKN